MRERTSKRQHCAKDNTRAHECFFESVLCARFEQVNAVASIHLTHASHVTASCERHRVCVFWYDSNLPQRMRVW